MTENQPIRILIVDDHAMVRSGLRNFINAYEWMLPVGEAANGAEALAFCLEREVDVVLLDMVMPEMNGIETTQRIMALGKPIKIIILTSFQEQEMVEQALKAGAISYLLKNVTAAELARAIRAAYSGQPTLAPEAITALINATRRRSNPGDDLTAREKEVLALLVKGYTNSAIADQLSISLATVKFHINNIYSKIGTRNRIEAVTLPWSTI